MLAIMMFYHSNRRIHGARHARDNSLLTGDKSPKYSVKHIHDISVPYTGRSIGTSVSWVVGVFKRPKTNDGAESARIDPAHKGV